MAAVNSDDIGDSESQSPMRAGVSRLVGWLRGSLVKVGRATVVALAFALWWAWAHSGAIQLLPFEGTDGTVIALRLGRALEDVASGSTSDIEVDPLLRQANESGPPPVSIPGSGVSFASLVSLFQLGPLAETRVHGALVNRDKTYQIWLKVFGPHIDGGVRTIRTEVAADLDQVLVQAAESLYGLLKPVALASYHYRRDPQRCLEIIKDILSDPQHSADDEAAAYRIWGLLLSDKQDFEGAREKFDVAIGKMRWPTSRARRFRASILVDRGHTYRDEQRWDSAAADYEAAAKLDERWEVPYNFLGDALQESGLIQGAIARYNEAIERNHLYVEPWNGLGRVYMAQKQYQKAIEAYTEARRRHRQLDRTAAFTYFGLGDALFKQGRYDAAAEQYDRGMQIDHSYEAARYDWALTSTCQVRQPLNPEVLYTWRPNPAPVLIGDPPAIEAYANGAIAADCLSTPASTS